MSKKWLNWLKRLSLVRGILVFLRNVNAFPENYSNLSNLSYEAWRNRFLRARLNLAFGLVLCADLTRLTLNITRFFYSGETLFDKYLLIQAIGVFSLLTFLGVLQTTWGRRHLGLIFLGLSWSLEMNEQIIETLAGVFRLSSEPVSPELLNWGSTFFTQATLIPVVWPLHLLSQVITLGYYFSVNRAVGFDTIPNNYNNSDESLRLFLILFWICLICDFSVYLYERLQRAEFSARQQLEVAEAKYRSIFENSVEGLFQSTPEGRFINVNQTLAHIYGYQSPQEMIAEVTDINRQMYVNQNRRAEFVNLIHQQGAVLAFESQVYRADGQIIWISENARAVKNEAGKIILYEGDLEEITERKKAEEEVHKALQQEKELNQLKSRFVSTISHEFRTPLTTILAASEALEYYSHKWTPEKKQSYFNRIKVTIQHMTDLLNDVLIIGQSEAQKLPLKPVPLNLEAFCQNLVEEIQFSVGDKYTLKFTAQSQPDPQKLPGMDERLLRHIVSNLLSNAIKYSPMGGEVDFQLTYQNDQVILSIQDNGIGIPKDDQKHLFESFHRANNVGTIPGTGLGLAIAKRAVERHRGTITVQSEEGKGTIFIVSLPLRFQETELNEKNSSD